MYINAILRLHLPDPKCSSRTTELYKIFHNRPVQMYKCRSYAKRRKLDLVTDYGQQIRVSPQRTATECKIECSVDKPAYEPLQQCIITTD